MSIPKYILLMLQTLTIYQLFISLSYNLTKLQAKSQNEIIKKENLNSTASLERKLLLDIKYKSESIHKIKASIDTEGKILGCKYVKCHKKPNFENLQLPNPNQSFACSTIFGSIKFIKI